MALIEFDQNKPMDIVLIGRAAIDFNPNEIHRTLDKVRTFTMYVGGSPANIAVGVNKLGKKTFEQCAGFVKIDNPEMPLDNTTIHPESYKQTIKLLNTLGYSVEDIGKNKINFDNLDYDRLAEELDIGVMTLKDIVKELKKPGRDPREDMPKPILRKNVLTIEDLEEGMILQGTIRNIVDFGAFVDIGVHQDGLVHISQLVENKFVKHPLDIVSVGDIVDVRVLETDLERNRINLSMIL